ncbi:MAG: response regulator [Kiritimatiellia bacterium]
MPQNEHQQQGTALLVEDDERAARVMEAFLERLGYAAVVCDNGLSVFTQLEKRDVDVILLDLKLPELDGFEVLRRLKQTVQWKNIPVIVTTGVDDRESIVRSMKLGADDYAVKPIDFAGLRERIQSVLKARKEERRKRPKLDFSINITGARTQFAIAFTLVTLLPALVMAYMFFKPLGAELVTWKVSLALSAGIVLLVALGYALLAKYPVNVIRLRNYLELLTKGDAPGKVNLIKDEDDLRAIESLVSRLVEQTRERVRTIEKQTSELIDAETQRAMIESLGAACHHIGQPATVINTYLDMMRRRENSPETRMMIEQCRKASDEIDDVLEKLRNITEYRTEAYRALEEGETSRADENILKIERNS